MALTQEQRTRLAEAARDICILAGQEILRIYAAPFEVRDKSDHSPVTEADEAAERLILDRLRGLALAFPIVAEESAAHGDIPALDGRPFWLVDPLDGTREFISRNGEFTVNIALIEAGSPVLGAVHVPVLGRTYYAGGPGHAFRQEQDRTTQPIRARLAGRDGLVVVASRSHLDPLTRDHIAGLQVARFTEAGSSLKFCLLAEGVADHYPRFGRTMEWDTAAGHAVLLAAGGSVRTLDGMDLRYGKPGFENPPFIAHGREASGK